MTCRTTILFGPPGTGKTTTVLDMVEAELAAGADPARIGFFAFTRKAAREAIGRATQRFGLSEDDLPWFRTLHSAAFRRLGLRREEVMTTEHFRELGAALGSFPFACNYDETTERAPQGGGLGDRALAIYALARARCETVEEAWRKSSDHMVSLRDAQRFAAALHEYKQAMGLLDFSDFLDTTRHKPMDLDTIIIDEAQDLTLQQWLFARHIGRSAAKVVIAGDDDQAIFQWSGADVRAFLSLRGDVRVLPLSHRLPRAIWAIANAIVQRINTRRAKAWRARDDDGEVSYLDHIDQVSLAGTETWLLLVRHQYQIAWLRKVCRDQGVVYQEAGEWSNQAQEVRAVVAYEALRRGERVGRTQANLALRHIPAASQQQVQADTAGWDDIAWPFAGRPDWMTALTGISPDEREYIRRLRREGESLNAPGRVVLSTIHGIKGGEADNVALLPDMSYRASLERHSDQELRVWYVGASRARKRLFLVSPSTKRFFE